MGKGGCRGVGTIWGRETAHGWGRTKAEKAKDAAKHPGALQIAVDDFKKTGLTPNQTKEIQKLGPGYTKKT